MGRGGVDRDERKVCGWRGGEAGRDIAQEVIIMRIQSSFFAYEFYGKRQTDRQTD